MVGAYQEDSNATGVNGDDTDNLADGSGAAYVFTRDPARMPEVEEIYREAREREGPLPPPEPPVASGRLAFSSNRDGRPEIYVLNLDTGALQRVTNNGADDWLPDWSPDGGRLAFTSARTGSYDLWVSRPDGGGQELWVGTAAWDEYPRWAPDGQRLSFSATAKTNGVDNSEIWVRQSNGSLVRVTTSQAEDQWADWSPDGRLAYTEGFKADSN